MVEKTWLLSESKTIALENFMNKKVNFLRLKKHCNIDKNLQNRPNVHIYLFNNAQHIRFQ